MAERLELGRRYHCRELNSGKCRTGIFSFTSDNMEVQLFDYERFFSVDRAETLHLQLENNLVVSMHNIVPKGPGRSSFLDEPPATIYNSGAIANAVVVGHRPWTIEDPIRRVWFSVPHAKSLLAHKPKLKTARSKCFPAVGAGEPLLEVEEAGIRVRFWYTVHGSWGFGANEWEPHIDIEFDAARVLENYLEPVHTVLQFLSAMAGFHLTPAQIGFSALTHSEDLALEDWRKRQDFSVEYYWSEAMVEARDLHARNSFAIAWDRKELSALKDCLQAWIRRDAQWHKATALMMGSLGLVKETSGHRLLMASRWLETIPTALPERALPDETVETIAEAAASVAISLGVDDPKGRIKGSLRSLRRESRRALLVRLVASVQAAFRDCTPVDDGIDNSIMPFLMQANAFRGLEAHSVGAEGAENMRSLYASIVALEALCYLLMIKDLPMSAAGRSRALSSRLVRAFKYAMLDRAEV